MNTPEELLKISIKFLDRLTQSELEKTKRILELPNHTSKYTLPYSNNDKK